MRSRYVLALLLAVAGTQSSSSLFAAEASESAERSATSPPPISQANVSLPWEEFRRLLKQPSKAIAPPVSHVLSDAKYAVRVEGDKAVASVECVISTLEDGWTLVPLGGAGMSIVSATLDDKPCQLVVRENMLQALVRTAGDHAFSAQIVQNIRAQGRQLEITLPLLDCPIVSITAELAGADVQVSADAAISSDVAPTEKLTRWSGTFRGGSDVQLRWRDVPAHTREPRIYATTNLNARVDVGLVSLAAQIEIETALTATDRFALELEKDDIVVDVVGQYVRRWEETTDGKKRTIDVWLTSERIGTTSFLLRYDRELDTDADQVTLTAPRVVGARREDVYLAVGSTPQMEVKSAKEDYRVGMSQLPASLRNGRTSQIELAYHLSSLPASVELQIARPVKKLPTVLVHTSTLVTAAKQQLRCEARCDYEVLHTGLTHVRMQLPDGLELTEVRGETVHSWSVVKEAKQRVLIVDLKDMLLGKGELTVKYIVPFKVAAKTVGVPLLRHTVAVADRGHVAVQLDGNLEVSGEPDGSLERIDVKELPSWFWQTARSPLLLAYRYDDGMRSLSLDISRHEDLSVLVAVCDICEASTVVTPDGKVVTKMMYIVRNNAKPFLTLQMPKGTQLWSALVDDRPVTPARNKDGDVLIPLKKSEELDEDDEDSYRQKREERRAGEQEKRRLRDRLERIDYENEPRDLKPYDVELVFVSSRIELAERGSVAAALPQGDIPVGHLAWAMFLPRHLRVVDTQGSADEVSHFSLPFRHFGEDAYLQKLAAAEERLREQAEALAQLQAAEELAKMAENAKAEGVLPVRIEIPITGELHRFEQFLLVDEPAEVTLDYRQNLR